jgi:HEAT repeat protein
MGRLGGALVGLTVLLGAGAGAADEPPAPFSVTARGGRLTVTAADAVLVDLVNEVGHRAGMRVEGTTRLGARRIAVAFRDLPVEAALARLLAGFSYVVVVGGGEAPGEVRIVAETAALAAGRPPAPAAASAPGIAPPEGVAQLLDAVADPEQAVRLDAIGRLGQLGRAAPMDELVGRGLAHPDPLTRLAVLTAGLRLPPEVLVEHALHDAAPGVRAEALAQLPRFERAAAEVFRTALTDPDGSVRLVARERLGELEPDAAR